MPRDFLCANTQLTVQHVDFIIIYLTLHNMRGDVSVWTAWDKINNIIVLELAYALKGTTCFKHIAFHYFDMHIINYVIPFLSFPAPAVCAYTLLHLRICLCTCTVTQYSWEVRLIAVHPIRLVGLNNSCHWHMHSSSRIRASVLEFQKCSLDTFGCCAEQWLL